MTGVLIRRESLDKDLHTRTMPCKDVGRDRGDASTSQGTEEGQQPQAEGEVWNRSTLTASEGTNPTLTVISDLGLQNRVIIRSVV